MVSPAERGVAMPYCHRPAAGTHARHGSLPVPAMFQVAVGSGRVTTARDTAAGFDPRFSAVASLAHPAGLVGSFLYERRSRCLLLLLLVLPHHTGGVMSLDTGVNPCRGLLQLAAKPFSGRVPLHVSVDVVAL